MLWRGLIHAIVSRRRAWVDLTAALQARSSSTDCQQLSLSFRHQRALAGWPGALTLTFSFNRWTGHRQIAQSTLRDGAVRLAIMMMSRARLCCVRPTYASMVAYVTRAEYELCARAYPEDVIGVGDTNASPQLEVSSISTFSPQDLQGTVRRQLLLYIPGGPPS